MLGHIMIGIVRPFEGLTITYESHNVIKLLYFLLLFAAYHKHTVVCDCVYVSVRWCVLLFKNMHKQQYI